MYTNDQVKHSTQSISLSPCCIWGEGKNFWAQCPASPPKCIKLACGPTNPSVQTELFFFCLFFFFVEIGYNLMEIVHKSKIR